MSGFGGFAGSSAVPSVAPPARFAGLRVGATGGCVGFGVSVAASVPGEAPAAGAGVESPPPRNATPIQATMPSTGSAASR